MTQTLNLDALIAKVVAKISEVLHAERSSLLLLDPQTGERWSRAQGEGTDGIDIRFPQQCWSGGVCRTYRTGAECARVYTDPRFNGV